MGNTKSICVEPFLQNSYYINSTVESEILKKTAKFPVVSYTLARTFGDGEILKLNPHVDAIGSFRSDSEFDILIDDEIHYQNIKDFSIILSAMWVSIIKIRTAGDPVSVMFTGYTFQTKNL